MWSPARAHALALVLVACLAVRGVRLGGGADTLGADHSSAAEQDRALRLQGGAAQDDAPAAAGASLVSIATTNMMVVDDSFVLEFLDEDVPAFNNKLSTKSERQAFGKALLRLAQNAIIALKNEKKQNKQKLKTITGELLRLLKEFQEFVNDRRKTEGNHQTYAVRGGSKKGNEETKEDN